jgi:hypothetical protein
MKNLEFIMGYYCQIFGLLRVWFDDSLKEFENVSV